MKLTEIRPMLEVNNVEETIDFYVNTLGFQCLGHFEKEWAQVQRDNISIMFCRRFSQKEHPNPILTGGIYLYTDDVDSLWEEWKDKTQICYPIETFHYGMREFAVYDCNQYMLQVGEIK